jgi:hypothetical protein
MYTALCVGVGKCDTTADSIASLAALLVPADATVPTTLLTCRVARAPPRRLLSDCAISAQGCDLRQRNGGSDTGKLGRKRKHGDTQRRASPRCRMGTHDCLSSGDYLMIDPQTCFKERPARVVRASISRPTCQLPGHPCADCIR